MDVGKNQNQKIVDTLTDAIRARKSRKELLSLAIESVNKEASKLSEIDKTSHLSHLATIRKNLSAIGEKIQ